MATILDLITRSLRDIGAIGISEVPTSEEAQDALLMLNDMLDTWSTEKLIVFNTAPQVFTYATFKSTYTIGPGGDFDTVRPVRIQNAYNRQNQAQPADFPIYVTGNYEEYSDIITKTTQSSLVTVLYYDGNYPLQNLYLWPVPNSGDYSLVLWTWSPITDFDSIASVISLPPGYSRALRSNLSIELCSSYGKVPSQTLVNTAIESKAQLKRLNNVLPMMSFDSSLTRRGKVFNWLNGDTV